MDKIKLLLATSRPISWVNTAYPFAAGYLVLGGSIDARLVIGTLFFLIPYNLLMYGINDVFDYESDIRNPRKGGVEGAITPKSQHRLIILASVGLSAPFVIALLAMGTIAAGLTLAAVLFTVVAYSAKYLRFKEIPYLDSLTSSSHFVGPLIYAFSLLGASEAAWLAAGVFFLWGIASHAFGAVQDVIPDREGGLHSIATVQGARATVWLAFIMYALAVGMVSMLGSYGVIVAVAGLMYVANVAPYLTITDETSALARAGWKRFLWINYIAGAVVTIVLVAHFSGL